eukprot:NODE_71_length_24927_cov_1.205937.p10 type:complete len:335 gc:universal NODE_71_length_24927_cov_1.205937:16025-15021(-)
MLELPLWTIFVLLFYFISGFSIQLYHVNHVVIARRLPHLLFVDQWLWFTITVLQICGVPCMLTQALTIILLYISLLRTAYIYNYLSEKKCWVKSFNYLFWGEHHKLRKLQSLLICSVDLVLSLGAMAAYNVIQHVSQYTCEIYPPYIRLPFIFIFILAGLIFIGLMFRQKVKDRIGMRNEVIGRVFSAMLVGIVSQILQKRFPFPTIYIDLTIGIIAIFWGVWYPLIYLAYFKRRNRTLLLPDEQHDFSDLMKVGKQFFCSENILFLQKYYEYQFEPDELILNEIINSFIKRKSKFQLNLCEKTRISILDDPTTLHLAYDEVIQMVRENLLIHV